MSEDSSKPKSTDLGRPWVVILLTLGFFFVSQFLAALIMALFTNFLHPGTSLESLLKQSAPTQFIYILIAESLAVGAVIFFVRRVKKLGLSFIGLGRRPKWRDLGSALLGFGVFYGLLIAVALLLNVFAPNIKTDEPQEVGFNILNSSMDYVLAFAALAFIPPIGEETLMRGYLYSGLRARWPFLPAMLVTSLLFGLAHLGSGAGGGALWVAGIDTFVLSLVLVYLREKTGALYACMLLHSFNNTIAFFVHFH